jgi:hypothetical protein
MAATLLLPHRTHPQHGIHHPGTSNRQLTVAFSRPRRPWVTHEGDVNVGSCDVGGDPFHVGRPSRRRPSPCGIGVRERRGTVTPIFRTAGAQVRTGRTVLLCPGAGDGCCEGSSGAASSPEWPGRVLHSSRSLCPSRLPGQFPSSSTSVTAKAFHNSQCGSGCPILHEVSLAVRARRNRAITRGKTGSTFKYGANFWMVLGVDRPHAGT